MKKSELRKIIKEEVDVFELTNEVAGLIEGEWTKFAKGLNSKIKSFKSKNKPSKIEWQSVIDTIQDSLYGGDIIDLDDVKM